MKKEIRFLLRSADRRGTKRSRKVFSFGVNPTRVNIILPYASAWPAEIGIVIQILSEKSQFSSVQQL